MTHLHWPPRPARATCSLGRCLVWQADGGPYRIWKLDGYEARTYYALVAAGKGAWRIVSRHRNPTAARKSCETHRRQEVATR